MVSKLQYDPAMTCIPIAAERGFALSITALFSCLMLSLFAAFSAQAHGPFDHSSRLLVGTNQLELVVAMGADATQEFLARSGLPTKVLAALDPSPPSAPYELPLDVTAKLFDLSLDGKVLSPSRITVATEGMETIFTLVFPRPSGGVLNMRAAYFNGIEPMKHGSFVAYADDFQTLGTALLSRAHDSVEISLPPIAIDLPSIANVGTNSSQAATAERLQAFTRLSQPPFGEFLKLGVEHILFGFDHLLFLCALLMGVRKPAAMLWIITCFTLAHSVTLALSALNLVTVPTRVVEPLIALSIIVAAAVNLWRKEAAVDRYWLAGGFGLIHGFGFASVLRDTGIGGSGAALVKPLFAFNFGVELGQLAVLVLIVPPLFALRRWPKFVRYGNPALSTVLILLSGYWLLERTVFLPLMSP
jgi:hydrogenase/urease accessory protein HupE